MRSRRSSRATSPVRRSATRAAPMRELRPSPWSSPRRPVWTRPPTVGSTWSSGWRTRSPRRVPALAGSSTPAAFGDFANTLGQSLAVSGLGSAGSGEPADTTSFLLQQQCGAGYFRLDFTKDETAADQSCEGGRATGGSAPDTDVTALAVLSLVDQVDTSARVARALGRAESWLVSTQKADGSFGGGPTTEASNANSTGLAGRALAALGRSAPAVDAAVSVRRLQAAELAQCPTSLSSETGAIALNATQLAAGRTKGIPQAKRDQWRRASAQALPALQLRPRRRAGTTAHRPDRLRQVAQQAALLRQWRRPGRHRLPDRASRSRSRPRRVWAAWPRDRDDCRPAPPTGLHSDRPRRHHRHGHGSRARREVTGYQQVQEPGAALRIRHRHGPRAGTGRGRTALLQGTLVKRQGERRPAASRRRSGLDVSLAKARSLPRDSSVTSAGAPPPSRWCGDPESLPPGRPGRRGACRGGRAGRLLGASAARRSARARASTWSSTSGPRWRGAERLRPQWWRTAQHGQCSARRGSPLTDARRASKASCARSNAKPRSVGACKATANAYWGLFWSDGKSGEWTYATSGVDGLKVPTGGFVAFAWQGTSEKTPPVASPVNQAGGPEADPQAEPQGGDEVSPEGPHAAVRVRPWSPAATTAPKPKNPTKTSAATDDKPKAKKSKAAPVRRGQGKGEGECRPRRQAAPPRRRLRPRPRMRPRRMSRVPSRWTARLRPSRSRTACPCGCRSWSSSHWPARPAARPGGDGGPGHRECAAAVEGPAPRSRVALGNGPRSRGHRHRAVARLVEPVG